MNRENSIFDCRHSNNASSPTALVLGRHQKVTRPMCGLSHYAGS